MSQSINQHFLSNQNQLLSTTVGKTDYLIFIHFSICVSLFQIHPARRGRLPGRHGLYSGAAREGAQCAENPADDGDSRSERHHPVHQQPGQVLLRDTQEHSLTSVWFSSCWYYTQKSYLFIFFTFLICNKTCKWCNQLNV